MTKAFRILLSALFLLAGCLAGPQGTKGAAGPAEQGPSPVPTGEPSLDTPPVAFPGEVDHPKAPPYPSGTCWGLSIAPKTVCRVEGLPEEWAYATATASRSVWKPAEIVTIEIFTHIADKEEQIGGEPVVLVADEDPEARGVQTKADDSGGISFGIVMGEAEGRFSVRVSGSSERGRICGVMTVGVCPFSSLTGAPLSRVEEDGEGGVEDEEEDEDTSGESLIPEGAYFLVPDPEVQIMQWALPAETPSRPTKKRSFRR